MLFSPASILMIDHMLQDQLPELFNSLLLFIFDMDVVDVAIDSRLTKIFV